MLTVVLVPLALAAADPRLCFPIMATAGALGGPGVTLRHLSIGEIDLRIVIGVALGGVPAVLVAAFLVRSMSIELLRWLVVVVVIYAAGVMSRASMLGRRGEAQVLNRAASSEPPVALPSE